MYLKWIFMVIWLLSQTLGFPLPAHGSAAAFNRDAYNAVNHPQHEADGRYEFNYLNGSDAYQAGHQFGYVAAGIGLQVGVVAATEGLGELAPVEEGMAEESTVRMGGTMKLVDAAGEEEVAVAEGVRGGESEAKTALTGNSFTEAGQGEFGFAKDLESKPAGEAIKQAGSTAGESAQNGASQARPLELNLSRTASGEAAETGGGRLVQGEFDFVNNLNAQRQGYGLLPAGEQPYQLTLFPDKPYTGNRVELYGVSPTRAQKAAATPFSFDHDPTLVQHYWEGDGKGGLPGFNLTQTERLQQARSLNGNFVPLTMQNYQGSIMKKYSIQKNSEFGF